MQRYVVMGVSGCGKTSVGAAVAGRLNALFIDGDDLHPRANIDKMSRGEALTDDDREPWLIEVGQRLAKARVPMVIGCSALKRSYRDTIRREAGGPVCFLHLKGSYDVLSQRMQNRPGHFMPTTLLDSQLAALEPLGADEAAIEIDIDQPFDQVVDRLAARIKEDCL